MVNSAEVNYRVHQSAFMKVSTGTSWGMIDHATLSGCNFVTMILLAKALGPTNFGTLTVALAGLMLCSSIQSAAIAQPHNVIGAALSGQSYRNLTISVALSQVLFSVGIAVVAFLATIIAFSSEWSYAPILLMMIPYLVTFQWHEFVRRVMYTEDRQRDAALNNALKYACQAALTAWFWSNDYLNSVPAVLTIFTVSSGVAAVVGSWILRSSFHGSVQRHLIADTWNFGKFLGLAAIAGWLSTQVFAVVAALMIGTTAAGTIRAGEMLMRPLGLILSFLDVVLPVRFSKILSARGEAGLNEEVKKTLLLLTAPVVAFCAVIALFGPKVMDLVFGQGYASLAWMPSLFALYYLLVAITRVVSSGIKANRGGRLIMRQAILSAVIALSSAWLFVLWLGTYGVLAGMIAVSCISLVILWSSFFYPLMARAENA